MPSQVHPEPHNSHGQMGTDTHIQPTPSTSWHSIRFKKLAFENENYNDKRLRSIFVLILFLPLIYLICLSALCDIVIKKYENYNDLAIFYKVVMGVAIVVIFLYFIAIFWIIFLNGKTYGSQFYFGIVYLSCGFFFIFGNIAGGVVLSSNFENGKYKSLAQYIIVLSVIQVFIYLPLAALIINTKFKKT
jgi:uncharacterized BrkB/YihY/UPF0761 family membrane protein